MRRTWSTHTERARACAGNARSSSRECGLQAVIDVQRAQLQGRRVRSRASAASSAVESDAAAEGDAQPGAGTRRQLRAGGRRATAGPNSPRQPRAARATSSRCVLGKHAEAGDLLRARRAQLIARDRSSSSRWRTRAALSARGHRRRIAVRAAERLLEHLIDEARACCSRSAVRFKRFGGHFLLVLRSSTGSRRSLPARSPSRCCTEASAAGRTHRCASAPPEPPSPVTTVTIGMRSTDISNRLRAIASLWPRSSAPTPG